MAVEHALVLENLCNVLVHLVASFLKERRLAHESGIQKRHNHEETEESVEIILIVDVESGLGVLRKWLQHMARCMLP